MKNTLITTSFIAMTGMASAATLIDFSDANLITTVGNWNNMTNPGGNSITDLIDDTGVKGTIDLALTFDDGSGFGGSAFNTGDTGAPAPFDIATAYGDGLYTNIEANKITLAFTGLAFSTNYEFSLYGGRDNAAWRDADIVVTEGTSNGGDFLAENRSVTTFSIISTASGTATFTFSEVSGAGGSDTNATINAMSITAIPEPSTTALLGLGGISLILRRRK